MSVEDDVKMLRRLLELVRDTLEWLVRASAARRKEGRDLLGVLPEVSVHIEIIGQQVRSVKTVQDDLWRRLSAVGLTGPTLALKVSVLRLIVAPVRRQRTTPAPAKSPRGRKGVIKRLLQWINSFLGSLSAATSTVPFSPVSAAVDFVKEYKEMVELVVEHQGSTSRPPGRILDI